MAFSSAWEHLYASGQHMSVWPWSDLISLVVRYAPRSARLRVLELGVGAGANIPFFLSMGCEYYGIEGSSKAVETLRERFSGQATIAAGDFCDEIPFSETFDLIVDRASMTHNDLPGIKSALNNAGACLKAGGLFVGVTWFSTDCSLFTKGMPTDDFYVRRDFKEGFLANTGIVHFGDQERIFSIFKKFQIKHIEHRITDIIVPSPERIAAWNIVAQK